MSGSRGDPARSDRRLRENRLTAKAYGPGLQSTFISVVHEPVPGYWLALLRAAEHRESIREPDRGSDPHGT